MKETKPQLQPFGWYQPVHEEKLLRFQINPTCYNLYKTRHNLTQSMSLWFQQQTPQTISGQAQDAHATFAFHNIEFWNCDLKTLFCMLSLLILPSPLHFFFFLFYKPFNVNEKKTKQNRKRTLQTISFLVLLFDHIFSECSEKILSQG